MKSLETKLGRRQVLKGIVAAPMVSAYAAEQMVANNARAIPLNSLGGGMQPEVATGQGPSTYRTFAQWWTKAGKDMIKDEAKHISGFDADILTLHCPLATKVRYQRAKNYERLLNERESWFAKTLKQNGKVTWWD